MSGYEIQVPQRSRRGFGPGGDRRRGLLRVVEAAAVSIGLLTVMWVIQIVNVVGDMDLDRYGILPRSPRGLEGVPFAPFLHAGYYHLVSNSLPFVVLAFLAALQGVRRFAATSLLIMAVSGLGVWLISPANSITVGASGMILGYFGYLIARGILVRSCGSIFAAVVVMCVYGTLVLAVLPTNPYVSWQAHLFGLIGGILAAWFQRSDRRGAGRGAVATPGGPGRTGYGGVTR